MKQTARLVIEAGIASALLMGCGGQEGKMQDPTRIIRIGSDIYAPYFYVDDDGNFAGIDVEIAREATRRLGLKAQFVQIAWQNKDAILSEGEVDCLWGSFSMNGRENLYAWAGPYMHSKQVVVVNASSDIHHLKDLAGHSVAVQNGTKVESLFLSEATLGVSVEHVYSYCSISNVFATLKEGYVDAGSGHEMACRDYIKNISGEYRILDEALLSADLGVAFQKEEDPFLVDDLSRTLEAMCQDGTIRSILEKYDLDVEFALKGVGK